MEILDKDKIKQIIVKLNGTSELVFEVLRDYPKARNDDCYLLYKVYQKMDRQAMDQLPYGLWQRIYSLGATESITRARRKIQNTYGFYPPTDPQVQERRQIAQMAFHHWSQIEDYVDAQSYDR